MSGEEGKIVAEYESFSVWEMPISESVSWQGQYWIARSFRVPVSTYEDALLEPEWDVFI